MPSTDNSKKPKTNRLGRGLGSLFSPSTMESSESLQPTSPVPKKAIEQQKKSEPADLRISKPDISASGNAVSNSATRAEPSSMSTKSDSRENVAPAQSLATHATKLVKDQPSKDQVVGSVKTQTISNVHKAQEQKTVPDIVKTEQTLKTQQIRTSEVRAEDSINQSPNKAIGVDVDLKSKLASKVEISMTDAVQTHSVVGIAPTDLKSEVKEEHRIWLVPVDKIKPAKDQPRKDFNSEDLKELALSIRQKGIIQPITVRKGLEGDFEIVAGERRWRAAQQAGLHEVPVIIKRLDKQAALEIALIENIQRQDLNPIEESEAYNYLLTKYHLTQQQLADKVGKERATVANSLRLLVLAPEVRSMVKDGLLSVGHAKVLLSLPNHDTQKSLAKKIMNLNLSVRATEKLVSQAKGNLDEKNLDSLAEDVGSKLAGRTAQELQKIMGRKVSVDYKGGKGKLSIHFHSDEELSDIIEKLKNSWKN